VVLVRVTMLGVRDSMITWLADRGDTRPVALLVQGGIHYEQLLRRALGLQPEAVRRLWGLAPQVELDRTRERLSALEHRVRSLEARADHKEDA